LFGTSIETTDTFLYVGSKWSDKAANEAGSVRVYQLNNNVYNKLSIEPNGTEAYEQFGTSVAAGGPQSGVSFVAGSPGSGNNGKAGIYDSLGNVRDSFVGDKTNDKFGTSVACSPYINFVAVGAPNGEKPASPLSILQAGYVKVFTSGPQLAYNNFTQVGQTLYGYSSAEFFGSSVRIANDGTIVVGAPGSNQIAVNAGAVRVYKLVGGQYTLFGSMIFGEKSEEKFGSCISRIVQHPLYPNKNIFAVGAPGSTENGSRTGHVRIFEYDTNTSLITEIQKITGSGPYRDFGQSVDLSPCTNSSDPLILAVGGNGEVKTYSASVSAPITYNNDFFPQQLGSTVTPGGFGITGFGHSVALTSNSNKRLAIGAPDANSSKGYVRIYNLLEVPDPTPQPTATPVPTLSIWDRFKRSNENPKDTFRRMRLLGYF
jgi:hypothetical protein